uniref:Uncharacterized protein n=1 Tax=Candidatus Kentrum sp. MB TaxID=2138164 RepID=A0A451B9V4_9GAMM|nr:MAG: hypothetical protein BECKMB1821I_GA0114274_101338 [Candidatus Kentron sp. MB]VFK75042.1 MAG: hypothetical protein BECKMB1821H_GA0114242_101438 [Candidatus Kentron sp. MB]
MKKHLLFHSKTNYNQDEKNRPTRDVSQPSDEGGSRSISPDPRHPHVGLLSMDALRRAVAERFTERAATQAELDTVLQLLQSRGLVHRLDARPGETWILLRPERINQYGAAIIQAARNHPKDIGAVTEREVLTGRLPFTGFERLPWNEEVIVLEATAELLLQHDLGFREMGYLVFPSQIKVTRVPSPITTGPLPRAEVAYRFSGAIETIYASLVVRLSYTEHFQREDQWKYAVEFSRAGHRLGFSMQQVEEGTGELEIYFETGISEFDRVTFIRFITDHLKAKGVDIEEQIRLYCPNCDREVENREAIESRVARGKLDIPCLFCDASIVIPESVEEHYRRDSALGEKQQQLADTVERRTAKEVNQFRADIRNYNLDYNLAKNKQHLEEVEKIQASNAIEKLKELDINDMNLFHETVTAAQTASAERLYVAIPSRQFSDIDIRREQYLVVAKYISRARAKELMRLVKSDAPVVYAKPELAEEYWLKELRDIVGDDGVIVEIEL